MRRRPSNVIALLAVGFAMSSCSRRNDSAGKPASAEPTPSASVQTPAPPPEPVTAPFIVVLQAPDRPAKGPIELAIDIDAQNGFEGETEISVQLPQAAKLIAGATNEKLARLPQGKTTRTFKIAASKLTPEDPVRIVVEGRDPKGTFGARAERVYPERGTQ